MRLPALLHSSGGGARLTRSTLSLNSGSDMMVTAWRHDGGWLISIHSAPATTATASLMWLEDRRRAKSASETFATAAAVAAGELSSWEIRRPPSALDRASDVMEERRRGSGSGASTGACPSSSTLTGPAAAAAAAPVREATRVVCGSGGAEGPPPPADGAAATGVDFTHGDTTAAARLARPPPRPPEPLRGFVYGVATALESSAAAEPKSSSSRTSEEGGGYAGARFTGVE